MLEFQNFIFQKIFAMIILFIQSKCFSKFFKELVTLKFHLYLADFQDLHSSFFKLNHEANENIILVFLHIVHFLFRYTLNYHLKLRRGSLKSSSKKVKFLKPKYLRLLYDLDNLNSLVVNNRGCLRNQI